MEEKKAKAYKFSILTSVINIVVTGLNYAVFRVLAVGVAFIIAVIGSIVIITCYNIEKRNERKN